MRFEDFDRELEKLSPDEIARNIVTGKYYGETAQRRQWAEAHLLRRRHGEMMTTMREQARISRGAWLAAWIAAGTGIASMLVTFAQTGWLVSIVRTLVN